MYKVIGKLETKSDNVTVSVKKRNSGERKVVNYDKFIITQIESGEGSQRSGSLQKSPVTKSVIPGIKIGRSPPKPTTSSSIARKFPETKKFYKSSDVRKKEHQRKIFCYVCKIQYRTKDLLLVHLRDVHKVSLYKCDFCDEKFVTASVLETHIDSVHVRFPTKYTEVGKEEDAEMQDDAYNEPNEEIDWLQDDDDFQNSVLSNIKVEETEVFDTSLKRKIPFSATGSHYKGEEAEFGLSGGTSSIKQENPSDYEIEALEEDESAVNESNMWWAKPKKIKMPSRSSVDRSRMCHICGEMKAHLISHIAKVHAEHKVCQNCNQKLPQNSKMVHQCNRRRIINKCTCGQEYDIKEHLIGHILEQSSTEHEIQCSQCVCSFRDFAEYNEHQELQHPLPFSCGVCGKRFGRKENLKSHIYAVHVQRKSVEKCEFCGAVCHGTRNLKRHIKYVHQKTTRINCEICGLSCFDRLSLKRHTVFKHGGQKEFSCDVCKKDFATADALRYHLTIHTGERPFPCPFCPKAFKINSELRKHYRAHKDLTVKCPSCSLYCLNDEDLKAHLRRFPTHDTSFVPE